MNIHLQLEINPTSVLSKSKHQLPLTYSTTARQWAIQSYTTVTVSLS